jgi:hypothetical protein
MTNNFTLNLNILNDETNLAPVIPDAQPDKT